MRGNGRGLGRAEGRGRRLPKEVLLKRPSIWALLLGLVPFAAVCFSVTLWDRVHPVLLGLPFNLFWLIAWILLTPLCMWAAYRLVPRGPEASRGDGPAGRRGEGGAR